MGEDVRVTNEGTEQGSALAMPVLGSGTPELVLYLENRRVPRLFDRAVIQTLDGALRHLTASKSSAVDA